MFDQPGRGTQPPCTGSVGSTRQPGGLSLRARCSRSRPGGTRPPGAGLHSRHSGTQPPGAGRGVDQLPGRDSASGCGAAWLDQPCRRDSATGRGPRLSTSRPGETRPPCTVSVGSTSLPGGLSLRVRSTEVDQPAWRDLASGRGATQAFPAVLSLEARASGIEPPTRRDSASGRWAAWLDQPCRRDSATGRGPRGSTSRPCGTWPTGAGLHSRHSGTQPPGAGQHGWIRRAGATQPPCTVSVSSTSQPGGLNLRARCSTSLAGGLCRLTRDAWVDHPARRY